MSVSTLIKCLFTALLFSSCAQVLNPGGGQRDANPPRVVSVLPSTPATNFTGNTIEIEFDEYIQVKDINTQWVISPPLKTFPDYKVKGKKLRIQFKDTLRPNTTYLFNFGKSVCDLHENNTLENFRYVFSTGSFIDSLICRGTVITAETGQPEKDVTVMLYQDNKCKDDSFMFKQTPDYFAVSGNPGSYEIEHIKQGVYRAIAIKDLNHNFFYDPTEEQIGFKSESLAVDSLHLTNFNIFKETEKKLYLKWKSQPEYGHIILAYNKKVDSLDLLYNENKPADNLFNFFNTTRDTLHIWVSDFSPDSISFITRVNGQFKDTIQMPLIRKDQFKGKNKKVITQNLRLTNDPSNGNELNLRKGMRIKLNHPCFMVDSTQSTLTLSDHKVPITFKRSDKTGMLYHVVFDGIGDSTYIMKIYPGTFTDIYKNTNDTLVFSFRVPPIEATANLFLKLNIDTLSEKYKVIKMAQKYIIITSADKNEEVYNQLWTQDTEVVLNLLPPGEYKIKMFIDLDKNGVWTTGDLTRKQQPEPVFFLGDPVRLRANWDQEQEWIIKD